VRIEPAPGNLSRAFRSLAGIAHIWLHRRGAPSKRLPRRANHRHIDNIASIESGARPGKPVAGFVIRAFRNRTAAAGRTNLHEALAARRLNARRRPNHLGFAGANLPAAMTTPRKQAAMTAYLISLALAGLVAIALWEGLS